MYLLSSKLCLEGHDCSSLMHFPTSWLHPHFKQFSTSNKQLDFLPIQKKNVSIAQNIHNSHQITWYIVERLLYLHRQHFQRKIRSKIRIQKLFFNLSTPCQTFTPLQADFCLGNEVLVFALRHSVIQKFVQFMLQSSLAQFRQR